MALSSTVRVSGPIVSAVQPYITPPWRLTRPNVGRIPTMPFAAAGLRTDPPVSSPSEPDVNPAAGAMPDPLDEPAGLRARSHGLRGCPNGKTFVPPLPNS